MVSLRSCSARDLLSHLIYTDNLDVPVLVRQGLFGHRFSVISSVGMLTEHDVGNHLITRQRVPTLTASDDHYDDPGADLGDARRADSLRRLISEKGLYL